MNIQILGAGCAKCRTLAEHAEQAARTLGLAFTIEKVTDPAAIAAMGVMRTPALAVDGVVKTMGRVPTADEIKPLLA
ncbi:thioredoxin family protein [Humitalea sp. 24SJ18S-53]|uniref:thioredoxin family protein n=1 Tax=Humitalea sp. 24SJ18S-53 TaxID=3422307 RepID=UPI003D673576